MMAVTLAFPLRIVNGQAVTVEIDSAEHVAQCVHVAALTELGWRVEAPEFGIPSYLMAAGGVDVDELQACLARSEPRAAAVAQRVTDPGDLRADRIRILLDEEN
jgi:hypothetical protein